MFERLNLLINKEEFKKIENTRVLLVGLGGVGGECAVSLVRSGIKDIIIIDYDTVDITNLNRQVVAYHSTIGKKKTEVLEKILKDINSDCKVKIYDLFLDENNIDMVFNNEKIDFVIDCCDSIKTKKLLILNSLEKNINFISSMGTGNKFDPSKLYITDLKKTDIDPLARIMRKWAKDEKINKKIPVLCSKEIPSYKGEVIGSTSFVPNCAGLLISSYVIRKIINKL